MDLPPGLPEKLHLNATGKTVRREDIGKLSPQEREGLWYEDTEGHPRWPFYDDTGVVGFGDLAGIVPFMSRLELSELGWDDNKLEAEHVKLFGKRLKGAPRLSNAADDDIPLMELRRATFDDVMRVLTAG